MGKRFSPRASASNTSKRATFSSRWTESSRRRIPIETRSFISASDRSTQPATAVRTNGASCEMRPRTHEAEFELVVAGIDPASTGPQNAFP